MNSPAGFKIVDGKVTEIDPIAAMLNPASFHEVLHMTLAAFVATGFAVAAIHGFFVLRDRANQFHRAALGIALGLACVSAPLQIISRFQRPGASRNYSRPNSRPWKRITAPESGRRCESADCLTMKREQTITRSTSRAA